MRATFARRAAVSLASVFVVKMAPMVHVARPDKCHEAAERDGRREEAYPKPVSSLHGMVEVNEVVKKWRSPMNNG